MIQKLLLSFTLLFSIITFSQTTTWNGASWDNGNPDNTKDVVFDANFLVTSLLEAKSITLQNNAVVTVTNTVSVIDNITVNVGSQFIFENNSSLVQTNPISINTGNIIYRRNSTPIRKFEYTYWASPVQNQTLISFSPNTDSDRFHSFNTTTNNWVNEISSNTMTSAKGYAIRVPSTFDPVTPQIFNGEFQGIPNNGNITIPVIQFNPGLLNYNLIGNPYPCAISVTDFFDNNPVGAMYIWTHHTPISNNNFTAADYAVRTRNTGTAAYIGGDVPGEYIGAGQGFFASSGVNGVFNFTNTMRVVDNNSQFFRTAPQNQFYYFRLNATNAGGAFNQIALGYEEGATNGYDFAQDAFAQPSTPIKFYSLVDGIGGDFAIQGRAYPWVNTDFIQIGYTTTVAGDYTISFHNSDSFFNDKDIFIEDTTNNTFHNLKTNSFNFTTGIGTFNSRFKIRYQDLSLKTNENDLLTSSVTIYKNDNQLIVNSNEEALKSVEIYDVLGRLLYLNNNINSKEIKINHLPSNQSFIVKTILVNQKRNTQKIVL